MKESLEEVKINTLCPFAKKANIIEVAQNARTIEDISNNLKLILPEISKKDIDAAFVSLPDKYANDIKVLGGALRQILLNIDPESLSQINSPGWKLNLNNEKFFVAVFSDKFDENSSRNCPKGAFILFQPKNSFSRAGMDKAHDDARIRSSIRTLFAKGGKPYNHESLNEPQRFLPEHDWWKEN